jgi:hypothetical protein
VPIKNEIKNGEVKWKSFIFLLSNSKHNKTQNIKGDMSTMYSLSNDFPRQRLPYHRFLGVKLDRRASFRLSA